jgi:uncharacterized protein with GYD domain
MPSYLVQASYTVEALATLMKKPQDRTEVVRKTIEKLGGKLVGLWLSFGDQDVVAVMELPNNVSAAVALAIGSGGALKSTKTTPLLTVDEGIAAMKKAASSGYTSVTAK